MNNYSWLQQKLHQLALSTNFMREITFDIENFLIPVNQINDDHIFVSGLARSGTTALLNALYESNKFASLSYSDMPFVLANNLWSKLSFLGHNNDLIERSHGDGIMISQESPEAFEEVFWMTFNENDKDTIKKFRKYVQRINLKYKKERFLSKNNQNIKRLELLIEIFPNSKILIPFRNPIQHANSLLSQHQRFIQHSKKDVFIAKYMKWIGHTEFGPNYNPIHGNNLRFMDDLDINHWIEQWYLTYQNCFTTHQKNKNVYFICYEKLCSSKKYWLDILQKIDIDVAYDFKFKESIKDISHNFDKDIMNKALSVYSKLSEYRFH